MLTLLRQLPYLQNRKYVLSSYRSSYSKRIPAFLSKLTFGNPTIKDVKKKGYGEKEIDLLEEIDQRAPFPGRVGGIPLSRSLTVRISKIPRRSFRDFPETIFQLPEEKYKCIFSQDAYNVIDKAMSISNKVEYVAHKCPILLRTDFRNLFPSRPLDEKLTLITLCMKTKNDMSAWSEEAEKERKTLNEYFITSAEAITKFLRRIYWADFVHPTTGKPHSSPLVDDTMFETDLRYRNFGLQIEDLGCCRIISHPIWGRNVFVGAIFTNASFESFEVNCIKDKTLAPVLASLRGKPYL